MMRWLARHVRTWRSGVRCGAGHGGAEAILVFAVAAINTVVLLTADDTILQQTQAAAPQQVEAVRAQIEAIRAGSPMWVMRSVRGEGLKWLLDAILMHIAVNTIAVLAAKQFDIVATEAVLAVFGVAAVYLTRPQRRHDPVPA